MELLILCVAFGVLALVSVSLKTKKRPKRAVHTESKKTEPKKWGMADPEKQLGAIAKVDFEKRKLMNSSEYRVFTMVEKLAAELDQGYRVMAQCSLGEMIKPRNAGPDWKTRKDAFASINSKRIDIVVLDKFGLVALAVEYQGSGHHQNGAFLRDAVKREALRRAGIPMLEVEKGMNPSELRSQVMRHLAEPALAEGRAQ